MKPGNYLRILRDQWYIVVAGFLLGVLIGCATLWLSTPVYGSSVTFFVTARDSGPDANAYQLTLLAEEKTKSYLQLLTSDRLRDAVDSSLGEAGSKRIEIEASNQLGTTLMTATAYDPSPARAQEIAVTISSVFRTMIVELEQPANPNGAPPIDVRVAQRPALPTAPARPRAVTNLALGSIIGLLVGCVGALVRARGDTTLRSISDLKDIAGTSCLGQVETRKMREPSLARNEFPCTEQPEAYRWLRTTIRSVGRDNPCELLAFSSPIVGEEKSAVVCNLGMALAEVGRRVLLLDADLRVPQAARMLGLKSAVGLTSVLSSRQTFDEAVQRFGQSNLYLLASGPPPPNPSELLASDQMIELLRQARAQFDIVLIDTPPLLFVCDAAIIVANCDGALLVVRSGKVTRGQVEVAVSTIQAASGRALGTILVGPQSTFAPNKKRDYASDELPPPPDLPAPGPEPEYDQPQQAEQPAYSASQRTSETPDLSRQGGNGQLHAYPGNGFEHPQGHPQSPATGLSPRWRPSPRPRAATSTSPSSNAQGPEHRLPQEN